MSTNTDDNSEALLDLARHEFDAREEQVTAVQLKARSYLTLNGLVLTAGAVSTFGDGLQAKGCVSGIVVSLIVVMLASTALAVRALIKADSLSTYFGPPDGEATLADLEKVSPQQTRISLASHYAKAAKGNARTAERKARWLRTGIKWTIRAMAACGGILLLRAMLLADWLR